jgi:hypothetical protein
MKKSDKTNDIAWICKTNLNNLPVLLDRQQANLYNHFINQLSTGIIL